MHPSLSRRQPFSPCTWWGQFWHSVSERSTSWFRRCCRITCSLTSTARPHLWFVSPSWSGPWAASSAVSLNSLCQFWNTYVAITWKKKYDTNFSLDDRNSCGLNEISVTWFSRNPLRFQNKSLLCCFSLKLILSQLILGTEKSSFYCLS